MDNSQNSNDKTNFQNNDLVQINWTKEHETILIEWGDKAMCYRWLHSRSNVMYSNLNAWYTIPVIIISTLTGTGNFAQDRVPDEWKVTFVMVIGGFNILAGIITTIQQFLKITQLNEAHRVSSIAWDKFYRNIKIELSKHPSERVNPSQMLKVCKEEYDRLIETSPVIPDKIIKSFKYSFKDTKYYQIIRKPEICDELISTEQYRNPWLSDEYIEKRIQDEIDFKNNNIEKKNHLIEVRVKEVTEFKNKFTEINNREPMNEEIIDNLQNKIDIDILNEILYNYANSDINI